MLIVPWELDKFKAKCTWYCGSNLDVDLLWNFSKNRYTNLTDEIENYGFFEDNLKFIFSKENATFFKFSSRENWNVSVLIKGISLKDVNEFAKPDDLIIDLENISSKDLFFKYVTNKYLDASNKDLFSTEEWKFILKSAQNLNDLVICSILKETDIELYNWIEFISQERSDWYANFKAGTLLNQAIIKDSVIAEMRYILKASRKLKQKAIIQFLLADIKSGGRIWDYSNFWYDLIKL